MNLLKNRGDFLRSITEKKVRFYHILDLQNEMPARWNSAENSSQQKVYCRTSKAPAEISVRKDNGLIIRVKEI